jgi:hypothetical protein
VRFAKDMVTLVARRILNLFVDQRVIDVPVGLLYVF